MKLNLLLLQNKIKKVVQIQNKKSLKLKKIKFFQSIENFNVMQKQKSIFF